MRRLFLALAILLGLAPAQAEISVLPVVSCGTATLDLTTRPTPLTVDLTGRLCLSTPGGVIALSVATVNISTGTTTAIVAGMALQTIKVYRLVLSFAASQTLNIISSGGASLSGAALAFGANGGMVLDFDSFPYYTTAAGEGLSFTTTTTGVVAGTVYYVKS